MKTFNTISIIFTSLITLYAANEVHAKEHMHPDFNFFGGVQNPYLNNDELESSYWRNQAKDTIFKKLDRFQNINKAKNVIFFLGDGMSISTLTASRTYLGQTVGKTGEEYQLSFEKFPVAGLAKTYCVDAQVADSACTATAYLGGVKTNIATIGVTAKVKYSDCNEMAKAENHVHSIAKWFLDDQRSAGFVTTTSITDASPAGVYANTANRGWQSDADIMKSGFDPKVCPDIAQQLIHGSVGSKLKVMMGGGRLNFLPNTTTDDQGNRGRRWDGRNLIDEWKNDKNSKGFLHKYVSKRTDFLQVDSEKIDYLFGMFASDDLSFNLKAETTLQPTLEEMVEKAIKILSRDDRGYFLFVEGGRIDHGHHFNKGRLAIDETIELSKAVQKAVDMVNSENTLIVVTSDHAHTMTISGYPTRGNPVFGKVDRNIASDKLPYLTISYANGDGYRKEANGTRVDVTKDNMDDIDFKQPALVPLDLETHGGDDVAVFSMGPGQHLFSGLYEQNAIPHIIKYASCVNPELSACSSAVSITISFMTIITITLFHLSDFS